jgi:hypothetical protein
MRGELLSPTTALTPPPNSLDAKPSDPIVARSPMWRQGKRIARSGFPRPQWSRSDTRWGTRRDRTKPPHRGQIPVLRFMYPSSIEASNSAASCAGVNRTTPSSLFGPRNVQSSNRMPNKHTPVPSQKKTAPLRRPDDRGHHAGACARTDPNAGAVQIEPGRRRRFDRRLFLLLRISRVDNRRDELRAFV